MCRLLAYVTSEPVVVSDLLNTTLTAFINASHLHSDGWGFAWYDQQNSLQSVKTPTAAHASPEISSLAQQIQADAFIGHLRQATPGFVTHMVNTHPFTYDELAFAHNGLIQPRAVLEELIAPHLKSLIAGTTDSECHFLALLSILEDTQPIEGIYKYLQLLHKHVQPISANFLLLTPQTLYAVCDFDPYTQQSLQDPDYFPLLYRITPNAVLVGSTGLDQDEEWRRLGNGCMLVVNRVTLDVTIVNLAENTSILLQEPYISSIQH